MQLSPSILLCRSNRSLIKSLLHHTLFFRQSVRALTRIALRGIKTYVLYRPRHPLASIWSLPLLQEPAQCTANQLT